MKKYLILFTLFFISNFAFSKEFNLPFNFFIEPHINITYGELGEFLYAKNNKGKDVVISRLDWQTKYLYSYGLNFNFDFSKLSFSAKFDSALPRHCGKMFDSDWLEKNNLKTTYSIHDNNVFANYDVSFIAEYNHFKNKKFSIIPGLELSYTYTDFEASIGDGWKGQSDTSTTGESVSWNDPAALRCRVAGISYERQTLYTFLWLNIKVKPFKNNIFTIGGGISPYTYTYSCDKHHDSKNSLENGETFISVQQDYFTRYKYIISSEQIITNNLQLKISFSGIYGKQKKGDFYNDRYTEKPTKYSNQFAGSSISQFTITASCKIKIF